MSDEKGALLPDPVTCLGLAMAIFVASFVVAGLIVWFIFWLVLE